MYSLTTVRIDGEAIDSLVQEWKTQRIHWAVYDTPMNQADNFAESVLYLFLGSLLHWGLDGNGENGEYYCYRNQGEEGSIAFWKTFRSNWSLLSSQRLTLTQFSEIFAGLHALPEHYQQWLTVGGVLRQKYGGQIIPFLESCRWNVPTIISRAHEEFPAFRGINGRSARLHWFLYLAQGKFFSANLFNGTEKIETYMDSVLLAGLIQVGILVLPSDTKLISIACLPEVQRAGEQALAELVLKWQTETCRKILLADFNSPLRNHGIVSIWRHRFPLIDL